MLEDARAWMTTQASFMTLLSSLMLLTSDPTSSKAISLASRVVPLISCGNGVAVVKVCSFR